MKTTTTLSEFLYGAPPPRDIAMEEAILGAILIDTRAIDTATLVFGDANPFYLDKHRVIYDALRSMHRNFRKIDLLTATDALRKAGTLDQIGGPYALTELSDRVASTANLEAHCRIVQQMHIQREIIRTSAELTRLAHDPTTDALELLDAAQSAMQDFSTGIVQPMHIDAARIAGEVLEQAQAIREGKATPGLPTYYPDLDTIWGGLVSGEVYILAGRPGMGKTALAMSIARRMAARGKKVGIFSLEMSRQQLMQRIISGHSGVALQNIMNPRQAPDADYKAFIMGAKDCAAMPILIDDTGGLSITQLSGKARAMRREGVELLVVDYIQLMNGGRDAKGKNREQEISQISAGLKAIAKELRVPIIAVSQLSRAVEVSADKKPQLRHLRESGSLEQDAYSVAFVYRPEYYEIERDADGNSLQGLAMILVEKNRNGETGQALLRWHGPTVSFSDYAASGSDFAMPRGGEDEEMPF